MSRELWAIHSKVMMMSCWCSSSCLKASPLLAAKAWVESDLQAYLSAPNKREVGQFPYF